MSVQRTAGATVYEKLPAMLELPAHDGLMSLADRVNSILPVAAFGFTRRVDAGRVSILHVYRQGMGEWIVADADCATRC